MIRLDVAGLFVCVELDGVLARDPRDRERRVLMLHAPRLPKPDEIVDVLGERCRVLGVRRRPCDLPVVVAVRLPKIEIFDAPDPGADGLDRAGHVPDPGTYRAFLQRKREEVEAWPEWKRRAAEAAFAPKIDDGQGDT